MLRGWIFVCALLLVGCSRGPVVWEPNGAALDAAVKPTSASIQPTLAALNDTKSTNVAGIDRRIIYKAEVSLVVSDFSATEDAIPRLVRDHGGYLANASIDHTSGEHRLGSWQARIPLA